MIPSSMMCTIPCILFIILIGNVMTVNLTCEFNFNGENDVVFLLDLSKSVGQKEQSDAKSLIKEIIREALWVRPKHTRVALVTFDSGVQVRFNYFNAADNEIPYECELMQHLEFPYEGLSGNQLKGE